MADINRWLVFSSLQTYFPFHARWVGLVEVEAIYPLHMGVASGHLMRVRVYAGAEPAQAVEFWKLAKQPPRDLTACEPMSKKLAS